MSNPPDDADVARYQAELLRILHEGTSGEAMAADIETAQRALGVEQQPLDHALVEVAADLTRTWGRIR